MTDEITLDAPETRIERFLAAAAGVEGITLDEPKTRIENYLSKIAEGGGSGGLPPVTASDAGKVLSVDNSGVWGASLNQVEILADYNPATGIFTQRSGADVPTVNELVAAFLFNGAVIMRVFVNDHQAGRVYLYPLGDENGGIVFGTVVRNASADYDESINVLFSVDDEVAFSVYKSKTPKGRFIVTLTPTAQDFSGTMDKTVAEINAAYEAGQEIVFRIVVASGVYYDMATTISCVGAHTYPEHFCIGLIDGVGLIAISSDTDTAESTAYYTKIYTLTPAT